MTTKTTHRDRAAATLIHYLGQAHGRPLDEHCADEICRLIDDIIDAALSALINGHYPLPSVETSPVPVPTKRLPASTPDILDQPISNSALEDALTEYAVQKEQENYQRRVNEIGVVTRDLKRDFSAEVVELLNFKITSNPTVQAVFMVNGNRLALRKFPYESGYKHYWKVCWADDPDLEGGIDLEHESKEELFDAILTLMRSKPSAPGVAAVESTPDNQQLINTLQSGIQQITYAIALNGLLTARWVDAHDNTMELDAPDFDSLANDAIDLLAELDAQLAIEGKSP